MRKLKLQMQMSLDGFVAGPNGELDWMTWNMDEKLIDTINSITDSSDTILMGRKMTDGFIDYWTNVLEKPDSPEYDFAKKMIDIPKVVFSKTITESPWVNTTVSKDLVAKATELKQAEGKDIVAYGGAGFVSSLIENDLIDEFHLFVNPTAIGEGLTIFNSRKDLKLVKATQYECGIVINTYKPTN